MDTESSIKTTLSENERELGELMQKRAEIDDRIHKLVMSIRSLANLLDDDIERIRHHRALESFTLRLRKPGLSQMILNVLFAFPDGLSPVEIRKALVNSGALDAKEYVNPATSIHTTLRRLVASGEVEPKRKSGKKIFRIARQERVRCQSETAQRV